MGKEWDIENYTRESLYKIALVILAFLLLFRQCGSNNIISGDSETIVVNSDTVYVKGKEILIPFHDTVFQAYAVSVPTPPDTIYLRDSSEIAEYNTSIEDSLLSGIISTTLELPSKNLISQKFTYTPKFPKRILRVDTVKIETTITKTIRNERAFLVGAGIGASPTILNLELKAGIRDNKGKDYVYSFDILQKSHNFGIIIPLRWR